MMKWTNRAATDVFRQITTSEQLIYKQSAHSLAAHADHTDVILQSKYQRLYTAGFTWLKPVWSFLQDKEIHSIFWKNYNSYGMD